MKEIKDPGVIFLSTPNGEPVMINKVGPDGKPGVGPDGKGVQIQASMTMREFLYDRITNAKFTENMQGIDAILCAADAKKELDAQAKEAMDRGYWLVEDDRARKYLAATLQPQGGYNTAIQHCLVPIVLAIRDMKDHKPTPVSAVAAA